MLLKIVFITSTSLVTLFSGFTYFSTFNPAPIEHEDPFNAEDAPLLKPGQEIKVLSWNVQFMAGKNYVFFFDTPNHDGPDTMPCLKDIALTFKEVARIIKEEDPDFILLQEVDSGSRRTYYEDQLTVLLSMLPEDYKAFVSSYYWKNTFVPHPCIMGATGMKLAIISKYKIEEATRHQLSLMEENYIRQAFNLKRSVLKARLPIEGGHKALFVLNTHLSAFAKETNTMQKQVLEIKEILNSLEEFEYAWLIGGDFNLLLPNEYEVISEYEKVYYNPNTELKELVNDFSVLPSLDDVKKDRTKWYTHFSNDPVIKEPSKTIDYIFYSKQLGLSEYYVRNKDTLNVSDHFPIISIFKLPETL